MSKEADKPKAKTRVKPKIKNSIETEVLPPEAAEKLAKEFGPDGLEKVEGVLIASRVTMGGPLPVSSEFEAYDLVLPGAAREILDMAKKEQDHRHSGDLVDLRSGIKHQFLALFLGAGLLLVCILGAIFLALKGQTVVASLLLGVAVLGVISSIIKSRPVFSGRVAEKSEPDELETN